MESDKLFIGLQLDISPRIINYTVIIFVPNRTDPL